MEIQLNEVEFENISDFSLLFLLFLSLEVKQVLPAVITNYSPWAKTILVNLK